MRSALPLTFVLTGFDENGGFSPEDRSDPDARSVATVTALRTRLVNRPPAGRSGTRRYWFFGVCAALIAVAAFAYLLFPPGPGDGPGQSGPAARTAQPAIASPPQAPEAPADPTTAGDAVAVAPPAAAPAAGALEKPALHAAETIPAPTAPQPSPAAPAPTAAAPMPPAQPSAKTIPPKTSSGLKLVELVVCREVSGRRSVGPQRHFRYGQSEKPHVWMTVYARQPPRKLTHVYFHDGRRHVTVPLAIRHPRTRTWSRLTIDSAAFAGSWRVAVMTENGEQLGEAFFEVGP
ncbi:MAG: DUF2914 domain-containing protein [Desulfobacterales bacterium]